MNRLLAFFLLLIISGCHSSTTNYEDTTDMCLRKMYFDDCMKSVHEAAKSKYNGNFEDMLGSCSVIAHELSKRLPTQISDECKSGVVSSTTYKF